MRRYAVVLAALVVGEARAQCDTDDGLGDPACPTPPPPPPTFTSSPIACMRDAIGNDGHSACFTGDWTRGADSQLAQFLSKRACASVLLNVLGLEHCWQPCEVDTIRCYRNPSCRPYFILPPPPPGSALPEHPVYFDYSQLLRPSAIDVQVACASVMPNSTSFAQPQPFSNTSNCRADLAACLADPECRGCFHILQGVNASTSSSAVAQALTNTSCVEGEPARLLNRMASVTTAGDCWKQGVTLSPNTSAVTAAWECMYSRPDATSCISSLGQLAVLHGESFGGRTGTNAGSVSWEAWFAALSAPPCQRLIKANGSQLSADACRKTIGVLPQPLACQLAAQYCSAQLDCSSCFLFDPAASSAEVQYSPKCELPLQQVTQVCPKGYLHYASCPETVGTNNRVVIATSTFGVLSLLGSVAVLAVIHGHRKDLRSLRERILVGIFFGNCIYSLTNIIPVGLESTEAQSCGAPVLGGHAEAAVRGMWFWGKYTMVLYELFVVYASIVALRSGSINMRRKHEIGAHVFCLATGLFFLIAFAVRAGAIYDDYLAASNYGYQQAMLKQYDQLVELFVQIWLVLLTGMVALWFVQLWIHHKLKREWAENVAENEDDMKRDLWNTSDPYVLGRRKLRIQLLDLIADARDEIARPLEPYVIVFILFAIPAIIMATDWCEAHSEQGSDSVNCQHTAEMILALRTLSTVAVYFRDSETQAQLLNFRELGRKVRARLLAQLCGVHPHRGTGTRVRYAREDQVTMICDLFPANNEPGTGIDATETETDDHDVSYASAATHGDTADSKL